MPSARSSGSGVVSGGSFRAYLNPKSMQSNSTKPKIIAIKAIILHTFGVQVGFRAWLPASR